MPNSKIDQFYVERIEILAEEDLNPSAITREITKAAEAAKRSDVPGESTVRRYYDRFKKKSPEERRESSLFRWPRAMQAGALPWSAAPIAFELLRYFDTKRIGRPTVRTTRWFYHVTLACPGIATEQRASIAAQLATVERSRVLKYNEAADLESLEWFLAYQPDERAYLASLSQADPPRRYYVPTIAGGPDVIVDYVANLAGSQKGDWLKEQLRPVVPASEDSNE